MKKRGIIFMLIFTILIYFFVFKKEKYIQKQQQVLNCANCLIKDEEDAIALAEIILFNKFGESKITNERPYKILLIDNKVWKITGSLNKTIFDYLLYGSMPPFGGTFEIKIDSKTAKILSLMHYK